MRGCVLVLALLAACKRDDNGEFGRLPDAHVTFLNDGAGPENEAPLEPARAGTRAAAQAGFLANWQRWMGALDAGRDDVLTKEFSGGNQLTAPTIGQGVGLYRFTRDGLVAHAVDAPLDDETLPVLMVPETVRVGMAWESDFGDGTVSHMEVVRHEDVMLPTGPASVWTIDETVDAYNTNSRLYAEGIGRIDNSSAVRVGDYTELVVPIDEQAHDEPALNPVPLIGAVPIELEGLYYEIWGLSGAVFDGKLFAYVDGEYPPIPYDPYSQPWPKDYCARLDSPPQWVTDGFPGCPTQAMPLDANGYVVDDTVLIDNAAMILPGVDTVLDVTSTGSVGAVHSNGPGRRVLTGWVVDGVAHSLMFEEAGFDWMFVEYPLAPDLTEMPAIADGISTHGAFVPVDRTLTGQIWIGPAVVQAGATIHFGVIAPDGRVFRVTLADGALSGFVPVGVLPGAPSILLNGDERLVYSITTDGRVFELRVDQATGDVAINALGAVRVEEPGGAYEFKGVLLDPAHPGDVYVAANATNAHGTSDPAYKSGLFLAHLDAEPAPLVSAASLSVGAAEMDAGLAVCWAPSDEPFVAEGWTLRGEPVGVTGPVGPNGNCALLDFDPTEAPDPNWVGAERAIEATVPGVGRVRLGFPAGRRVGHPLYELVAARPDGSLFDVSGLVLDRDGFPVSKVPTYVADGLRDVGGYGFWTSSSGPLRNIGGGGAVAPSCPDTQSLYRCYVGGSVVGGGIMVLAPRGQLPAQILVLRPDGTVENAPAAQVDPAFDLAVGIHLADGRICGLAGNPTRIDCVDTAGAVATTGPLTGGVVGYGPRDPLWPLSDGSLLLTGDPVYGNGPTLRFDPTTMTITALDDRVLYAPITSADGHVYAIAQRYNADYSYSYEAVEVTPTGVTDLMPVFEGQIVVPIDGALLVSMPWRRVALP